MRIHAYLGPTVAPDVARDLARGGTELVVHPPARCGDLLLLLRDESVPPSVLLVDGVYERVPAVWHKEILAVLAAGGRVIGCSSMGALRAAECAPWGAQPSGGIAHEYASGGRTHDADVAVAHAGPEDGHRALSVPLVDVEAALEDAVRHGILPPAEAGRVLADARVTFYAVRTWSRLLEPLDMRTADRMRGEVLSRPGRKEQDARETLAHLDSLLRAPLDPPYDPRAVLPTQQLEAIRAGLPASQHADASAAAPLADLERREDWPDLLRAGLVRSLVAEGRIPGITAPGTDEALTAMARQLRLPREEVVGRLAAAWDTTPAHVTQLGREQLQLAQLWLLHGGRARAHVIDHLRITGRFPACTPLPDPSPTPPEDPQ